MSYIIKTEPTILNIKLTNKGRELISKGLLTFNSYVLGDSEIDYNLIKNINNTIFSESILKPVDKNPKIISYIPQVSGGTGYNTITTVQSIPTIVTNNVIDLGFFESV